MNWLAIINELFSIGFLVALLIFLVLIWRSSERREQHVQNMTLAFTEVARQNAESARIVAEAVRSLAAIVQNEQAQQ